MAAFPSRDREAFMAHWEKIMGNTTGLLRTILVDGAVAGNIASWDAAGAPNIGYWLGREYWGQGIATAAVAQFVAGIELRPLYAHVAKHNRASIRVLEKCGFRPVREETGEGDGIVELVMALGDDRGPSEPI